MSPPDHLQALAAFADLLTHEGIVFHVGGSVASSAWGRGRSTADVDLVAAMSPDQVTGLAARAHSAFYIDEAMIREAIRYGRSFNVVHLETMIKIDVFVRGNAPYDGEAASRIRSTALSDDPDARLYPVAPPEDVVLRKLQWYRRGGETSERQWTDILGVLRVQRGKLDIPWMRHWAPDLEVTSLLERALAEAEALA